MWDTGAIEQAIAQHPREAAYALAAIGAGRENEVPNLEGLTAAAQFVHKPLVQFWVEQLDSIGLLDAFGMALRGQGVALQSETVDFNEAQWDPEATKAFISRATAFRCRIIANGTVKGSGILVGPSKVLTAWHVIAVAPPRNPQEPFPRIEVLLADKRRIEAGMPARFGRECGDDEYKGKLPRSDAEVVEREDIALLSLKESVGLHLGFAPLPDQPYDYSGPAAMVLIHYPDGEDQGIGFGKFQRLRNIRARWGHDLKSSDGSSGGGCFDTSFLLAGLHQGRASSKLGRLVPTIRFPQRLRALIAEDEVPDSIWSLDATVNGALVVGRDQFFHAYAAASRGLERVRGIWIKRTDPTRDVSGLPFSYAMLERMIARRPNARLVRISFDAVVPDLPDEISRRAAEAGFPVAPVGAAEGVGPTQTEPEAVIANRSRRLAVAIDAAARRQDVRLWFFFDHPAIAFGDEPRWALAAFVDQALRLDYLRLALAGYEAAQMPGLLFASRYEAEGEGMPGLMVEYLAGFSRGDVENLIRAAAGDLGRAISAERVRELADEALDGLRQDNGTFYEWWMGAKVSERLQPRLRQLVGGGNGS